MSAIGIRWPGARNGKKRMCSGDCYSSSTAMASCVPTLVVYGVEETQESGEYRQVFANQFAPLTTPHITSVRNKFQ